MITGSSKNKLNNNENQGQNFRNAFPQAQNDIDYIYFSENE